MIAHACFLIHWGRVTHICVSKLTIIGADNGLSPGWRQAIIRTNAGILLIGPLGTNFSEILIWIQTFSFRQVHLKMSSAKWRPFCLGLNELIHWGLLPPYDITELGHLHYNDVIMGAIASPITSLVGVCSAVWLGSDQRKHQSPASLAFVWGIHRRPVNSPHKGPVTRKMFPIDDVIMFAPGNEKWPIWCQAITWTNDQLLSITSLRTIFFWDF